MPKITAEKISVKNIKGERFQIFIKTDSLKTFAKSSDFDQEYGQYYTFDNQASIQISKNGKPLVKRNFTKETFRKLLNDKKFLSITILLKLNFVKYQPKNNLFKFETDIGMPDSDFIEAIEFHLNLKGKIVHWRIIPNKYF